MYPNLTGLNVLFLDDQLTTVTFGVDHLVKRLGGTVRICSSVDDAIACTLAQPESHRFHAVVVDYQVEGIRPGTDFAVWLWEHSDPAYTSIRRICYSGRQESQIRTALPDENVLNAIISKGSLDALSSLFNELGQACADIQH